MRINIRKFIISFFMVSFLFVKYEQYDIGFADNYGNHIKSTVIFSKMQSHNEVNPVLAIGAIVGESVAAFTLAEVLITLTVIGVVASMAIPALMNSTNDAEMKAQWKKMYATIGQTIILMKTDNGTVDYGMTYPTSYNDFTKTFLSYHKVKYTSNFFVDHNPAGWHQQSGYSNGKYWYTFNGTGPCIVNTGYSTTVLQDGTMMYITGDSGYYTIIVDINGEKMPNRVGKDIFAALVDRNNNSVKPAGSISSWVTGSSGGSSCSVMVTAGEPCDSSHVGWGCSAEYLKQ